MSSEASGFHRQSQELHPSTHYQVTQSCGGLQGDYYMVQVCNLLASTNLDLSFGLGMSVHCGQQILSSD